MTSISTSSFYENAVFNMGTLQAEATKLQNQIATGNRLASGADDPLAASQLRALARSDALAGADTATTDAAKTSLTQADDTLSSVASIVTQIHQLATQAASSTLNDSQRMAIGQQISALHDNLVALANSTDAAGRPLFGGQAAGPAYTLDAQGNATYAGSAGVDTLTLGPGLNVARGITGPQFLNYTVGATSSDLLALTKSLGDALKTGSGGQAAAMASLDQLSAATTAVTTAQAVIGARLAWIDTTTGINTQLGQQRGDAESTIGGTDVTSAISRLQQTMTVLQASQASFTKLAALSLFDLIK